MSEKRYYCDSTNENRDYVIFDLSKSPKTKEDFWNEEEECYELWRFQIYLMDETDAMMNSNEVEELLNKQDQEIQKYRDGFYKAHEMYQELLKQLSETKKERDEAIFKQKTLEKWYTCPTCAFHNKEFEYLKSLRKKD